MIFFSDSSFVFHKQLDLFDKNVLFTDRTSLFHHYAVSYFQNRKR